MSNLSLDVYVRDLPNFIRIQLGLMLDPHDLWERFAGVIPKRPNMLFECKTESYARRYTAMTVMKIRSNERKTESLLTDWGIQNCTIKHLIKALTRAKLYEAANYLYNDVLHLDPLPSAVPPQPREYISNQPNASGQIQEEVEDCCIGGGEQDLKNASPNSPDQEIKSQPSIVDEVVSDDGACKSVKTVSSVKMQEKEQQQIESDNSISPRPGDSNHEFTTNPTASLREIGPRVGVDQNAIANEHIEPLALITREPNETEDEIMRHMGYRLLRDVTDNFNTNHVSEGGNLVGTGGFGDVFLGTFRNGLKVAIKRIKEESEEHKRQFDNEIETLCAFHHEHLVTLLAYSSDGERLCLIYQYMDNGSLEDRLACKYNTPPLSVAMRVEIARGTAKGIAFLHSKGVVHRDIKSANILLDAEYNPKVGDFATAKLCPSEMATKIFHTFKATTVIGTEVYLAPEAHDFIIHPGLDVFSFGVVLLELVTGSLAYDENREDERDLKLYVESFCTADEDNDEPAGDIFDLRDKRVKDGWGRTLVQNLYNLSQHCLSRFRHRRIKISAVLDKLDNIYR